MYKYLFLLTLAFCQLGSSATYACYSDEEAEAEQALRIHSELMVIGLSCVKMPNGEEIYNKYRKFTDNNAELLAQYEERLLSYYRSEGSNNPEDDINSLRTQFANRIAQYSVEMSMLTFCDKYSGRLDVVEGVNSEQFSEWARFAVAKNPASEPRCAFN